MKLEIVDPTSWVMQGHLTEALATMQKVCSMVLASGSSW